jgi:hypothetical protein
MIGLTFKQKLQKGYAKPLRNKNYLKFVSSLTCPCGAPADEAHHIIDVGFGGGMGTKASDALTFPVCRACHTEIHQCVSRWEGIYGSQWEHVAMTLAQAIEDGAIEL